MPEFRFLDLCAGIGGFSLGLERAGMKCVGQVEKNDYCNKILAKHWPNVPRWGDITSTPPHALPPAELICGGYHCQPFSSAGKQRGEKDDRYLWPFILPIVAALRPPWCLFENVARHIKVGLDRTLSDLESTGYTCWPLVVPACAVEAPHERQRVWVLAYTDATINGRQKGNKETKIPERRLEFDGLRGHVPDAEIEGLANWKPSKIKPNVQKEKSGMAFPGFERRSRSRWPVEPGVGRMAYGISHRVDRLGALGNAVVPQIVEEIGRAILMAHFQWK